MLLIEVTFIATGEGWVSVTESITKQPVVESIIMIVYMPALKFDQVVPLVFCIQPQPEVKF